MTRTEAVFSFRPTSPAGVGSPDENPRIFHTSPFLNQDGGRVIQEIDTAMLEQIYG